MWAWKSLTRGVSSSQLDCGISDPANPTTEFDFLEPARLAQGDARRLAVLCPPHLAEQWQAELSTKFHIDAELVLASTAARLERGLPVGRTLFDQYPYVIVSTDCGMKYLPRDVALGKLRALVKGAEIMRREIGRA